MSKKEYKRFINNLAKGKSEFTDAQRDNQNIVMDVYKKRVKMESEEVSPVIPKKCNDVEDLKWS